MPGVQDGDDAAGGLRLVPPRLVQGEMVRYRPPNVSKIRKDGKIFNNIYSPFQSQKPTNDNKFGKTLHFLAHLQPTS